MNQKESDRLFLTLSAITMILLGIILKLAAF